MRAGSFIVVAVATMFAGCTASKDEMKLVTPVDFSKVQIQDGFWSPRLDKHVTATLPVCIDQIENKTGRMRNFENAAARSGEHSGIFFDDSDVYKALEGMAYTLVNHPDSALEAKCDEWIDKFAAAQLEDGYINTYYTLRKDETRWTDMDRHEMYCAGHLTEAAVAYYRATGKKKLLGVAERMAEHMMSRFGPGKEDWVPGHEEIELALVKLYEVTGKKEYLDFAGWLLEERGHGHWKSKANMADGLRHYQEDVSVREMEDIRGHAVRAMYLYCGMADVAAYTHDEGYISTLNKLWDDVVLANMYVTGGIGQSYTNEGFTHDYSLPNETAYCETCASVGMVLWNWRMNQFTEDAKYIDVLERSLYNGALAGLSLAGDRFFYVNPLASAGTHHRQEWYGCACCPSQICRFLPSIGNYIYGISKDAILVNLYIGDEATFDVAGKEVTLVQKTDYPWNGRVSLTIGTKSALKKAIKLRIPAWCKDWSVAVNGQKVENPVCSNGYAVLAGKWNDGDEIVLDMDMPVEMVEADYRVKEDIGKRAIQRGPIVYCLEEADNPEDYENLVLSKDASFQTEFDAQLLCGVQKISTESNGNTLTFIPYYAWDNREPGRMKVWVDLSEENQE